MDGHGFGEGLDQLLLVRCQQEKEGGGGMNGPEHYRKGDEILIGLEAEVAAMASNPELANDPAVKHVIHMALISAQAHFTAALVAATVRRGPGDNDWALAIRGLSSEGPPE
jgi:hypothetical protein